jgi:hypothetical protein
MEILWYSIANDNIGKVQFRNLRWRNFFLAIDLLEIGRTRSYPCLWVQCVAA